MNFHEQLTEYYNDVTRFLYRDKLRNDIIEVRVLPPRSCSCSYSTIFGRCDGSMIRVYYSNQSPHTTCPVYRGGLKLHPARTSNIRW